MKKNKMIRLTGDADKGLRQLRKDTDTLYRWAKRKYKLKKLRKMKVKKK